MKKIGVFTYNHPHKRTQQLLFSLKAHGINDVIVIILPWKERINFEPIYKQRIETNLWIYPFDLAKNLGYKYYYIPEFHLSSPERCLDLFKPLKDLECILLGGGPILPASIVQNFNVINSHTGYLPIVRGLDCLKWAIYQGTEIAQTTHICGVEVDTGILIERRSVPLSSDDTFHSIAQRQLNMETTMFIDALHLYKKAKETGIILGNRYPTNRRMPHNIEYLMIDKLKERLWRLNHLKIED